MIVAAKVQNQSESIKTDAQCVSSRGPILKNALTVGQFIFKSE